MKRRTLVSLLAMLNLAGDAVAGAPLGTAFTYQARLTEGSTPYTGSAEFQATLWDAVTNGSQIAVNSPATVTVSVSNGLFVLPLNFGPSFSGEARWLQLEVRTTLASFTLLSPRQPLTPAPYALNAALAGGLLSVANAPIEMTVSGQRALRLEPATNGGPNVIGGSSKNFASVGVSGATISGGGGQWRNGGLTVNYTNQVGGDFGTVGGGAGNRSSGDFATIGGGVANTSTGMGSTVGGGGYNTNSGYAATVSGGQNNLSTSDYATVGGGVLNTSSGTGATVGGGGYNFSSGYAATVGGGKSNQGAADYATVGGGATNVSSGFGATVGGGFQNISRTNGATVGGGWGNSSLGVAATIGGGDNNDCTGSAATIPGGTQNAATGNGSFAAGHRAQALHDGAFVWGDDTVGYVQSTTSNSWTVRATGGVRFFDSGGVGVRLSAGSNAWSPMSDRAVKENFKPVDPRAVLEKVSHLPVTEWNLISQPASIRHIGPMAQDFQAVFGVGEDDKHISTSDADGVALAAIQGLNEIVKEKEAEIRCLKREMAELKAMVRPLLRESGGDGQ